MAMTVKQLKDWLRGLPDEMPVVVADSDREAPAVFTTGTDEDLTPCVVVDLCASFE